MKRIPKLNLQLHSEKKRYYSLYQEGSEANIYIYGDITSWPWLESDVSSYNLSKQLQELGEGIESINVYINSYGGEVAEGLAIYNALKRHKAKVTTIADGFACSIASVIFSAGDERVVYDTSLLMIHNAWTYTAGNANDLRKEADDLEKITQASIKAYMNIVNVSEDELKEMLDKDTWLNAEEALEKGFATKIMEVEEKSVATQSVRKSLLQKVMKTPEKVKVASLHVDAEALSEKIVQKIKEQFKEEDSEESSEEILQNLEESKNTQQTTNKPINMMRAFFNLKEEE